MSVKGKDVELKWRKLESDQGHPVTGYAVRIFSTVGNERVHTRNLPADQTTCCVNNLIPHKSYKCQVTAECDDRSEEGE